MIVNEKIQSLKGMKHVVHFHMFECKLTSAVNETYTHHTMNECVMMAECICGHSLSLCNFDLKTATIFIRNKCAEKPLLP